MTLWLSEADVILRCVAALIPAKELDSLAYRNEDGKCLGTEVVRFVFGSLVCYFRESS